MANTGRPPKLAGQEEQVVSMYLAGATIVDLQEHFGCSDTPIIRILDAAGIERRRGRPPGRGSRPRLPRPVISDPSVPDIRAPDNGYVPDPEPQDDEELGKTIHIPSVGPRASRSVMDEVFRRDGYRCRLCGSSTRLTVEFAIPPENGGNARNPTDLRTVCAPCATKPTEKPGLIKRLFNR
jgi:hypothetical protein